MKDRVYVLTQDPDCGGEMSGSGFAVVTTKKVLAVGIARMPRRLVGMHAVRAQIASLGPTLDLFQGAFPVQFDRALVEYPIDYGQKRFAKPEDLMRLASVSGAGLALMGERKIAKRIQEVYPYQWKGQRSKRADWKNTLRYYGYDHTFNSNKDDCVPKFEFPDDVLQLTEITAKNMPEILDAMGIGIYGLIKEGVE